MAELLREDELELLDYRVELDVFAGPLDLLLYLVQREEIDIFDIPIARITQQYLDYIRVLQTIDMALAGEFLVMASTLMEIKSRMLLPQREEGNDEGADDPRKELVRQLLEYRRYRQAAERLQELNQQASLSYTRCQKRAPADDEAETPVAFQGVQVWDLVAAFGRLLRDTQTLVAASRVVYDETPIEVYMERIEKLVGQRGQVAFSDLFQGARDRGQLIGLFLALLELVRTGKVRAEQNELFGEIWILPPAAPAESQVP